MPTSPKAMARLLISQTPFNLFESLAPICAPNNTPIAKAIVSSPPLKELRIQYVLLFQPVTLKQE